MKIVLDTNVLIAAFTARGACSELLEHCVLRHQVILSRFILNEFDAVLTRKFGFSSAQAREAAHLLQTRTASVHPVALPRPASRHSDDDMVIATAVAGACDCIVTGDKDLLCLGRYQSIEILRPEAFWRFERERGKVPGAMGNAPPA